MSIMVGLDALGVGGCALVDQVMLLAVGHRVDGHSYSALGYCSCHICVNLMCGVCAPCAAGAEHA